jgi:hypothetical protein
LTKTKYDTKWKKYKNDKDKRLKNKGRFGMNIRTCWIVVEEKKYYDEYLLRDHGCVSFLDRSYIQDTYKETAIENTTILHEVASYATEVPSTLPRIWPGKGANLPCNCDHCT